jgi:hypothetical protein
MGWTSTICRRAHNEAGTVQDVRVNHRRLDIAVPEKFLDRPYVRSRFEQMSGEAVTQGMAAHRFRDADPQSRRFHRSLERRLVEMVPPDLARARIDAQAGFDVG